VVRVINNTRERLLCALQKKVREEFDHEPPATGIRRQLLGHAVNEEAKC